MVLRHRPRRGHDRRHLPSALATLLTSAKCLPGSPARSSAPPQHHARPPPRRRTLARRAGPAAYLATVIARGANQLAALTDGRKRALSALAYHAGGLLQWSGADREHITGQLTDAGTAAGLRHSDSARIVHRALVNGTNRPIAEPGSHLPTRNA